MKNVRGVGVVMAVGIGLGMIVLIGYSRPRLQKEEPKIKPVVSISGGQLETQTHSVDVWIEVRVENPSPRGERGNCLTIVRPGLGFEERSVDLRGLGGKPGSEWLPFPKFLVDKRYDFRREDYLVLGPQEFWGYRFLLPVGRGPLGGSVTFVGIYGNYNDGKEYGLSAVTGRFETKPLVIPILAFPQLQAELKHPIRERKPK